MLLISLILKTHKTMSNNLFSDKFSSFQPQQQKENKKATHNWKELDKHIKNFQLARETNDLQLQDYYYWEIQKITHSFLMQNHIYKYNWSFIYPDYDDDFFWMFDYQFLRRIADYGASYNKDGTLSKKQIHTLKGKTKNYMALIICLSKYVHENLIYWYTEKKFKFLDMRKMMKNHINIGDIAMHYWEWTENLSDFQPKYQDNQVANSVNSQYIMEKLLNHLKSTLNNISKTDNFILFKTFSKEALFEELEAGEITNSWKKLLRRIAEKIPEVKEYLMDLTKKSI